eukprot:jgi/Chrpa1/2547/Chrysochromulina_OHIO_Genome00013822-RA
MPNMAPSSSRPTAILSVTTPIGSVFVERWPQLAFCLLHITALGGEYDDNDDIPRCLKVQDAALGLGEPMLVLYDFSSARLPPMILGRKLLQHCMRWADKNAPEWDTQVQGIAFVMPNPFVRSFCNMVTKTVSPPQPVQYCADEVEAIAFLGRAEFLLGENLKELLAYGPRLADAEALLWIPPGSPAVLRELVRGGHLPNLKWVHGFYAGIDPIAAFAREELVPAKVPLSNGRGAFSSSLAEWSICAAMHFIKQIPRCMANRRARKWDKFVMGELRGLTLGLLGSGDIATATARLGKAFGMRTVALRRNARKPDTSGCFDLILGPYDGPVLPAHKKALFEQCHVVVCTLPGTPETFHFVGAREFDAMLPGAVFVSLGRGVAVDELALDAALRAGKLGGAALDVFEVEPLPAQSPLWDPIHGERLLISAHNADYTETYFKLGWEVWQKNLDAFLRGEPPVTPVDPAAGY